MASVHLLLAAAALAAAAVLAIPARKPTGSITEEREVFMDKQLNETAIACLMKEKEGKTCYSLCILKDIGLLNKDGSYADSKIAEWLGASPAQVGAFIDHFKRRCGVFKPRLLASRGTD